MRRSRRICAHHTHGVDVSHRLVQVARLPSGFPLWWSPCERIRRRGCTKRLWTLQARAQGSRVAGGGSHRQAGRPSREDLVQKLARVTEVLVQECAPRGLGAPWSLGTFQMHFSCAQNHGAASRYVRATNEMHWDIPTCHNKGLDSQAGAHRCDLP